MELLLLHLTTLCVFKTNNIYLILGPIIIFDMSTNEILNSDENKLFFYIIISKFNKTQILYFFILNHKF